jgi:hypothetical protein
MSLESGPWFNVIPLDGGAVNFGGEFHDGKLFQKNGAMMMPDVGRMEALLQQGQLPSGNMPQIQENGNIVCFKGELRDNKPFNGSGVMMSPDGSRFEGEFRDGKPYKGSMVLFTGLDGDRFEGEVCPGDGQPKLCGKGAITINGARYEGEYDIGYGGRVLSGTGVMMREDGSRFEGEARDGKPFSGNCNVVFQNGGHIQAELRDGQLSIVKMTNVQMDGKVLNFEGELRDNKPFSGEFVISMPDGGHVEASLRDGKPNSMKMMNVQADGKMLNCEIEFVGGEAVSGNFVLTISDGGRIECEIRNGSVSGGKMTGVNLDGNIIDFEGELREGKPFNGRGVFTSPSGGRLEAVIRDGQVSSGKMSNARLGRNVVDFEGELRDGLPYNGCTVVTMPDGGRIEAVVRDGQLSTGKMTAVKLDDGKVDFEGELRDEKPFNGSGVMMKPDGSRFEGEFRDGEPYKGSVIISSGLDGDRFEGELCPGDGQPKLRGKGAITINGTRYEGEYNIQGDRVLSGTGVMQVGSRIASYVPRAEGLRFKGEVRDNKPFNGTGMYQMPADGGTIEFTCQDGQVHMSHKGIRDSKGILYDAEFDCNVAGDRDLEGRMVIYTGLDDRDRFEARGRLTSYLSGRPVELSGKGVITIDGTRYEGEYDIGLSGSQFQLICGTGVATQEDCSRFEGEVPSGTGIMWIPGGKIFDGEWANFCPVRGTAMEADGTFFHAEFDGSTRLSSQSWSAARRKPAGRIVEGLPPCGIGGGAAGVWVGAVELCGDRNVCTAYRGELRGLRPCGKGVLIEAGGMLFQVEHDGTRSLAEELTPVRKEVDHSRPPCPLRGQVAWLLACSSFDTICTSFSSSQTKGRLLLLENRMLTCAELLLGSTGCDVSYTFCIDGKQRNNPEVCITNGMHGSSRSAVVICAERLLLLGSGHLHAHAVPFLPPSCAFADLEFLNRRSIFPALFHPSVIQQ